MSPYVHTLPLHDGLPICQSYLLGCADKCTAVLIDPSLVHIDRYRGLLAREGLRLRYAIDTHTHADHFSAVRQLKEEFGIPAVMHSASPARSEEHTSELQSLMRISYAVFRLKKKKT